MNGRLYVVRLMNYLEKYPELGLLRVDESGDEVDHAPERKD